MAKEKKTSDKPRAATAQAIAKRIVAADGVDDTTDAEVVKLAKKFLALKSAAR